MLCVRKKNKYVNSRHFLLVYYPLKVLIYQCDKIKDCHLERLYIPINSFDRLIDIEKYITSNIFLDVCFNNKLSCIEQMRVLVGVDSNSLSNTLNNYPLVNTNNKLYYHFSENMIFLEEFIDTKVITYLNKKIKMYSLKKKLDL